MKIASVGNLSGNVQIPHNCNTGHVCNLLLLLFLKILCGILLAVGTASEPISVAGDLTTTEPSVLPEHIVVAAEPSTSNYTTDAMRNVVAAVVV